ncbi:MAG: hypothetical protein M3454_06670, partial [Actinomycetota bacterium]|nr:hypothetical protein [Actinomycetota bacterium]
FIGEADSEFSEHDYEDAIEAAENAYDSALEAADEADVEIRETHAGTTVDATPPSPSGRGQYSHVDRIGKGAHRTRR